MHRPSGSGPGPPSIPCCRKPGQTAGSWRWPCSAGCDVRCPLAAADRRAAAQVCRVDASGVISGSIGVEVPALVGSDCRHRCRFGYHPNGWSPPHEW